MDNAKIVEKRSAENSDGRNLLMAYLGNVGGYDREYRSAEDENKPGDDHLKFHGQEVDSTNADFDAIHQILGHSLEDADIL